MTYLDNAATTPPDPQVTEAVKELLVQRWGNPSSMHQAGALAKVRLEEARNHIARLAGCRDDEVYFTSGGTEADNWALFGVMDYWKGTKNHLITVCNEHHAVLDTAHWLSKSGFEIAVLPVGSDGTLDPVQVSKSITPRTALVSVMHVNNELGTIQDVAAIGKICRESGVTFHTDCVQSFGKLRFSFDQINADLVSISSHKIYGPKGSGALLVKRGTRLSPRFIGGSQERGLRTGTENLPGIAGFGKAAEICGTQLEGEMSSVQTLRENLESLLLERIPDSRINGVEGKRAPGISSMSFPGCDGEGLLIALDQRNISVSTGSACSAGALGASHVLLALGLPVDIAQSTIRFSIGRFNTASDVEKVGEVLPAIVARQRSMNPANMV